MPVNQTSIDLRRVANRPITMPKSFLSYPTSIMRITNYPRSNNSSQRLRSARRIDSSLPSPARDQIIPLRPRIQYGHFLAYLRRQSLARQRRKQEEEEGNTDRIETTITLNLNKQSSPPIFHFPSRQSLASVNTDASSIPTISIIAKRTGRPPSSSHRSFRPVNPNPKNPIDEQLLSSSSLLITPRNSPVDETCRAPSIQPYLNEDLLNYGAGRGIHYRRHMLSSVV